MKTLVWDGLEVTQEVAIMEPVYPALLDPGFCQQTAIMTPLEESYVDEIGTKHDVD